MNDNELKYYVFCLKDTSTKEISKEEYNNPEIYNEEELLSNGIHCKTYQKYTEMNGQLYSVESKERIEIEFNKFEEQYPGYLEFLSKLQVDTIIKFNGLKFRSTQPIGYKKDTTIMIVYREEPGFRGRCPGVGCIEYGNLDENLNFTKCHEKGFFPCQTFMSMRDWFRASDSYEIIKETNNGKN